MLVFLNRGAREARPAHRAERRDESNVLTHASSTRPRLNFRNLHRACQEAGLWRDHRGAIEEPYRFHRLLLWTTIEPHDSPATRRPTGIRSTPTGRLIEVLATRLVLCANRALPSPPPSARPLRARV